MAACLALIGCGRLAERAYLPALRLADGVELVAVAEPDPSRRALARVRGYSSAADLLERERLDGVVVATPVDSHLDAARLAAAAGVPALVEKPPAPTANAAREIAALEPQPWVGFNRRFDPPLRVFRAELPDDGPVELSLELRTRGSWRPYVVADDVLLDLGPHLVDLVLWLTGAAATEVTCELTAAHARLRIDLDGNRGSARVSCGQGRWYAERVQARVDGRPGPTHAAGGLGAALRPTGSAPHPLVASLARQLEAFAAAIRGERSGELATAGEGVSVMAVLDAARRSAGRDGASEPVT